ncbi:MAG: lipopolysaccharide heptosyltransferase II [Candidatus Omnitrophica bacterium]|nr:lipopolysaccharide heptosyltransferase II [Candidatus Omnitrophota bacterium]
MENNVEFTDVNRIVVLRTDRIGEVLLCTPVIEALKWRFPEAAITFVTSSYSADVISGRSDVEEVITFSTINRDVSIQEAITLGSVLKKLSFDMAVVLNPHRALHIAVFLAGIRYRLGFNRKWGFLLNYKLNDTSSEGGMHEVDYNLGLLRAFGIAAGRLAPSFPVRDRDDTYVDDLLLQHLVIREGKLVVVHPGSSNPAKKWPAESFRDVVRQLVASNVRVVAIGDKAEGPLCNKILSGSNKSYVANFAGFLSVKQLGAMMKKADLCISNDNGPMHVAAAVGTKVVAVFGRNTPGTSPKRWGPYGEGHIVFHKDPGCSPCLDRECNIAYKCLTSITPKEVFEAAMKILQ